MGRFVRSFKVVRRAPITVFMPAYKAQATIVASVRSLLEQTLAGWELVVIADDGADYEAVLGQAGIRDPRIRFLTSGGIGTGAARTRNVALEAIDSPYGAILDADDRMKPTKLERVAAAFEHRAIVSCAIDVVDLSFRHLRHVGLRPDGPLSGSAYKWVNLSMDSMIAWDRRRTDARYDPGLPNMADLDFLIRLWERESGVFHIGEPLHDYVKVPSSLSNAAGVTPRMLTAKQTILDRLAGDGYRLKDDSARKGLAAFLRISMRAEEAYPAVLERDPAALFEDTIEPLLRANPDA